MIVSRSDSSLIVDGMTTQMVNGGGGGDDDQIGSSPSSCTVMSAGGDIHTYKGKIPEKGLSNEP